jgi:GntR family transcriptional regulator, transcriptional repressor for pyruvate dehydrogenase complex
MVSPIFKAIKQEKISLKIVNQIKSLIAEGKLRPGDVLPPERELIGILNVSRPSLREALTSLVGMGFLEITQSNRTMVKSLASGRILDPLDNLLKDGIISALELIEVRKAIETWNAYHAAQRAAPEDIAHLEKNLESMGRVIKRKGSSLEKENLLEKEDANFHLAISEATHNKIQTHLMFTIYDILKKFIRKYYENINYTDIYNQHANIVKAIKKKDSDLARVRTLEHLDYVESRIRQAVKSDKEHKHEKQEDLWKLNTVSNIAVDHKVSA